MKDKGKEEKWKIEGEQTEGKTRKRKTSLFNLL